MFRLFSFLALTLPLTPMTVQAQQYPDHPVKVVVGYAAGGGPDVQARTVAQQLSLGLGQQFFVENRLGANGTIATRSVVQSKPDGYTLLFSSNGIAPTPYIYKNLGYDLFTDLTPIATIGILDGLFMLVDAKSPYKTAARIYRSREKGSRCVRFAGSGQRASSCCGDFQQEGWHQNAAHSLQRSIGSHDRHAQRQR